MTYDDAGDLRDRITFQRFIGERDALGDLLYHRDECWEDVVTVWGQLKEIGSGEFYKAEQNVSYITHTVKIRRRFGVTSDMRIKCGSQVFRIESPAIDLTGERKWLQLKVRELVK